MSANRTNHLIRLFILGIVLGLPLVITSITVAATKESLPKATQLVRIKAFPSEVQLNHEFDYRQILLTGTLKNGQVVDVTRMVSISSPKQLVTISETGIVRPMSDGQGKIVCSLGGQKVTINVKVTGIKLQNKVSFTQDVMPILSKMGCNAGTCHGSQKGKNGFKLSLRGYDPSLDHLAFADDVSARRINRAAAENSLMLLKTTGQIPHVGGVLTNPGEPYYETLKRWISDGVKLDLESPKVVKIELFPKNPVVPLANMSQQIAVVATFSDGKTRDVSAEAFIESGDIEVIKADKYGLITTLRRGESPVLARYQGAYAATTITVMGDRSGFVWQEQPAYNYIDTLVYKKLKRVKTQLSGLCTDAEFVRRIYIDITGLPPTSDQTRAFLNDKRPSKTKREALVDTLIGSKEYLDHWTNKWGDLLQVNRKFLGLEGAKPFRAWIYDSIAKNKPYDQFVYEVLTAKGSNKTNPPASYFKRLRDPADTMENSTQLFLAVRFNCNKCHDHPFERWTQDQYYELAAYFAQVGIKADPKAGKKKIGGTAVEGAKPLFEIIFDKKSGDIKHVRTGAITAPKFPYQHSDLADKKSTRREQFAKWVVSKENQFFARSYVNRLWAYMLGSGFIEPIDDSRAGNPPTNPELLDALTRQFIKNKFDVRDILRTICKSRTYQLTIKTNKWNEDDSINYSHAQVRRLSAEVLYDAIHLATGSTPNFPGVAPGTRAAQLPDSGVKSPFLDDLGRPARESSCECERSSGMVLGPVMKLVNGPTIANAVSDPKNAIAKLVATQSDDAKLVEELYLRFLSRKPTKKETELATSYLYKAGENYKQVVANLKEYEKKKLSVQQAQWEKEVGQPTTWTTPKLISTTSKVAATFKTLADKSVLVSGKNGNDIYTIETETALSGITAIRFEVFADKSFPAKGPGRAKNGNFVLHEFQLFTANNAEPKKLKQVLFNAAEADFSQASWPVINAINKNKTTGWAISPQFGKNHQAIFKLAKPLTTSSGSRLVVKLDQHFGTDHTIGRFRISVTNSMKPTLLNKSKLPQAVASALNTLTTKRTAGQKKTIANYYRSIDPVYLQFKKKVDEVTFAVKNRRLVGAQDIAWALINNPAFLFNR